MSRKPEEHTPARDDKVQPAKSSRRGPGPEYPSQDISDTERLARKEAATNRKEAAMRRQQPSTPDPTTLASDDPGKNTEFLQVGKEGSTPKKDAIPVPPTDTVGTSNRFARLKDDEESTGTPAITSPPKGSLPEVPALRSRDNRLLSEGHTVCTTFSRPACHRARWEDCIIGGGWGEY